MCDPMTIVGAALTGASMVANNAAQNRVEKARKGAMTAERIRQNALQQEQNALAAQSTDRYQNFQGEQDQRASELGDFLKSQNQGLPQDGGEVNSAVIPSNGSNIVVAEQAKQNKKAKGYADQQAAALGELRAFGDLLGDKMTLQRRDGSMIDTLTGFRRNSMQGVLPAELEAANAKGDGLSNLGTLLGAAGNLGMQYGINKGNYNLFNPSGAANTKMAINNPATAAGLTYMVV